MTTIDAGGTLRDALTWSIPRLDAAGIESARLDAQLLLAWSMGVSREYLHCEPSAPLNHRAHLIFTKAIALREERRPLPYITGEQWFYGRPFKVNRAVLIPRPETEMLVDFAIRHVTGPGCRIADVCTGSGCIAVSIAAELPEASIWATDLSPLALHVTRKNVARHGVGARVTIAQGDLYEPLGDLTFDVIVANPPYITKAQRPDLMPEVRDYEPAMALWGDDRVITGDDGAAIHRRLLAGAAKVLTPGGWLALEVGLGQAPCVADFAAELGFELVNVVGDSAGIPRVVAAHLPMP